MLCISSVEIQYRDYIHDLVYTWVYVILLIKRFDTYPCFIWTRLFYRF